MKSVKKIAIIGVGFMGGSLSLALKEKFPYLSIWGFARSQKSYNKLKRLRIVNKVEKNLENLLSDADIVIFALPVKAIVDYFQKVAPLLKKGTVVFDLGSTKLYIEKAARKILPRSVSFVGCHPLAGSEKSGAEFSQANLYKSSVCFITSSPRTKATKLIKTLWEKLGCRVIFINPNLHDKILSCISHLPHLISFSLTQFVPQKYLQFPTGSFKDLTRISHSPASVWADIFLSNKANLLPDLRRFIKFLHKYEILLEKNSKQEIVKAISKANIKQKCIV